ncbi:MAG: hypothetical protein KR126chlam1_00462 [Chlamydiae bacterium]|nr:hypothetical protein [Chlamydiota bacterium]
MSIPTIYTGMKVNLGRENEKGVFLVTPPSYTEAITTLREALIEQEIAPVEELLQKHPALLKERLPLDGITLLGGHWTDHPETASPLEICIYSARTQDNEKIIELLIKKGVDLNQISEEKNKSLFHDFCKHTIAGDMLRFLLEKGANPSLTTPNGKDALYYAIGNPQCQDNVNILLRHFQSRNPNRLQISNRSLRKLLRPEFFRKASDFFKSGTNRYMRIQVGDTPYFDIAHFAIETDLAEYLETSFNAANMDYDSNRKIDEENKTLFEIITTLFTQYVALEKITPNMIVHSSKYSKGRFVLCRLQPPIAESPRDFFSDSVAQEYSDESAGYSDYS